MSEHEAAVSEIVSFILITGLLTACACISFAVVLPEMEKSMEASHAEDTAGRFCAMKSGIDRLWIQGNPGLSSGQLFPLSSSAGTFTYGKGTKLIFNHSDGQKTVYLLSLTFEPSYLRSENIPLSYEGGAVFWGSENLLPASAGRTDAVLICTAQRRENLLANVPVAICCQYLKKETFTDISHLQIADAPNAEYWKRMLSEVSRITVLEYTVSVEAVP